MNPDGIIDVSTPAGLRPGAVLLPLILLLAVSCVEKRKDPRELAACPRSRSNAEIICSDPPAFLPPGLECMEREIKVLDAVCGDPNGVDLTSSRAAQLKQGYDGCMTAGHRAAEDACQLNHRNLDGPVDVSTPEAMRQCEDNWANGATAPGSRPQNQSPDRKGFRRICQDSFDAAVLDHPRDAAPAAAGTDVNPNSP